MQPPPADWRVGDETVRELLHRQLPAHADERLELVAEGFDAWIYRLGTKRAVRIPRRLLSAPKIRVEQEWLPLLAPRLPLPVPVPMLCGRPEPGIFEHPWTVSAWLPGEQVAGRAVAAAEAVRLADFLGSLHAPAPDEAPPNPFRDGSLGERMADSMARADRVRHAFPELAPLIGAAADVLSSAAERDAFHSTWIHGDLHPFNLLASDSGITGVIDWIDLTAGDPALDAHTVWWFWPEAEQEPFWHTYPGNAALRHRARGWAVYFGLLFLDFGGGDAMWRDLATRILGHVTGSERG